MRVKTLRTVIHLALLLLSLLIAPGCGSSSATSSTAFTDTDTEFATKLAQGVANVTELAAPVLTCDPATCDRAAVRRLRRGAATTAAGLQRRIDQLSSPCLRSSARMLVHSIQSYGSYAVALEQGKERASLAALDDADNTRFKAFEKLAACGYLKHGESIGLDVQAAYQRLNRASYGIENCQARSCFKLEGRQIERAATLGIKQIQSSKARVDNECLRSLVGSAVVLFRTYQQFGRAARELDADRVQILSNRIGPSQARMARQAKQCATAGP